jgi:RimJ/RimL family protein N-acetyltransferase
VIQPVLHTPRLHLQPLGGHHVEALHPIWGDPKVIWWGHHREPGETAAFVRAVLERERPPGTGWWIVLDRDRTEAVGDVILQPVPRPTGEIEVGWHLARDHWGRGYATEGAQRLIEYAFGSMGLDLLVADIAPHNTGSIAVAERLGMRRRPGEIDRGGTAHGVWEIRR